MSKKSFLHNPSDVFEVCLIEGMNPHQLRVTRADLIDLIKNPATYRVVLRGSDNKPLARWEKDDLKYAAKSAAFRKAGTVEYTIVGEGK